MRGRKFSFKICQERNASTDLRQQCIQDEFIGTPQRVRLQADSSASLNEYTESVHKHIGLLKAPRPRKKQVETGSQCKATTADELILTLLQVNAGEGNYVQDDGNDEVNIVQR